MLPEYKRDLELESKLKEVTKCWSNEEAVCPHIVTIVIAVTNDSHLPSVDARIQVALFPAILTSIDDPAIFDSLADQDFHRKLCSGHLTITISSQHL